jgi:cobalt-zinc-cadmium efflux system outer membrane protein
MAPQELRAALEAAWARHPEAVATQATLDAATAQAEAASQPLYNPELELNADDEGPDRSATAGVGLTLDLSGKRRARSAVADAELDRATATARLRRRDFAQTWLDAWAALSAAERRVTLGARRTDLLTHAADLADRQFKVGDISVLDRDLALLARDEAAAEQASLVADLAMAKATFQTIDTGAATPVRVAFPAQEAGSVDTQPMAPVESLPEWTMAQSTAAAAQAQVTVAERERHADPTLSVHGGSIELADGARDNLYGISITVPLFVRNSYRAELAAAKAGARAAAADLERSRYELQARADRTSVTYRAVREAWRQWQQSPGTNVEARAELLERLWRAGEMSTSDYLLQLKQTVDTALAGAELEGRLWTSFTEYLAATGRLEQWIGFAAANGE